MPLGASTSCVFTRRCSPSDRMVPVRMASTWACSAIVFTSSSVEAAKREATMVDRTTRESIAASELVMASGKLTERKSDTSCRRRRRNGRTISRVSARGTLGEAPGWQGLREPLQPMNNARRDSCGEACPRRRPERPASEAGHREESCSVSTCDLRGHGCCPVSISYRMIPNANRSLR